MPGFCRDCLAEIADGAPRCKACGSPRAIRHAQLNALSIAHVDCDAFYATIEKRDDPSLSDKPLIIGGGRRGVVSTACYVARTYGIHSAMPMSASTRLAKRASERAGVMPCRRAVPVRSMNASSIESGSTCGVRSNIIFRTSRPTRTYFAMSGGSTTAWEQSLRALNIGIAECTPKVRAM